MTLKIDGAQPITAELVARVADVCDLAESTDGSQVVVRLTGAPVGSVYEGLTVGLVNKWERALRRLERLPATVVAVADGDCGGTALDALLATDYRVATASARLVVPVDGGATWPGMALFRLAQQGANTAGVRRAVLFGQPIDAQAALALRLVDEVTDDVEGALAGVAGLAAGVPGAELAIRRQLMFDASAATFEEALGAHLAACDRVLRREPAGAAS
ncbi:enoyl-CoA-hydratase DpgB [Kitasatospora aureofaciens]|uniref:enoyl-CoA-hydratase DpgB n=1 Tax=Kitasatospora aureofaciens TaxID=1894 RepID=UPI0037CC8A63